MARGAGVAELNRRRSRYAAQAAAFAASALSLTPGFGGLLLLAGALGAVVVWVAGSRGAPARFAGRFDGAGRLDPGERLVLLRWFVAGCQAITLVTTWPLWQPRDYPPLLPLAELPSIAFGPPLLASLGLVLVLPRLGIWAHLAALGLAFVADQTRLQPEVVSLALILVATNVPGWGLTLGRAHLASMWAWAGVHKMLSTDFMDASAIWMYEGLPVELSLLQPVFGWVVAGTELATGLLMLVPALRRLGVIFALGLHASILLVLSPWGQDWNESVWAWNLALGPAALVLFWPRAVAEKAGPSRSDRALKLTIGAAAAIYPLGFYFGLSDAYLSHHLYSDAVAVAYCEPVDSCRSADFADTWNAMAVPLPPEPRLYIDYFARQCRPGETLVVVGRRTRIFSDRTEAVTRYDCPPAAS